MPFKQLVSAGLERGLNKALELDPASHQRLASLSGKSLTLVIKELPWPITLVFSSQVDILLSQQTSDCVIGFSLNDTQQLRDSANITRLIQQQKLTLEGELEVAQHCSALFANLQIDWEEQLSTWLGDVLAHQLVSGIKQATALIGQQWQQLQAVISHAALEEKQLAVPAIAVQTYSQQVTDLRATLDRLDARIGLLEAKHHA